MAPACSALPVRAFPTWVINDQVIEGELDFDQLEGLLDATPAGSTNDGNNAAGPADTN